MTSTRVLSRDVEGLVVKRGRKIEHTSIHVLYREYVEVRDGDEKVSEEIRLGLGEPLSRSIAEKLGVGLAWDCFERAEGAVREAFVEAESQLLSVLVQQEIQTSTPKFAYAVQYIEVDDGRRHEGYKCWLSMSDAKHRAEEAYLKALKSPCYFGPVYPIDVIEVPWDDMPVAAAQKLLSNGEVFITDMRWEPPRKRVG